MMQFQKPIYAAPRVRVLDDVHYVNDYFHCEKCDENRTAYRAVARGARSFRRESDRDGCSLQSQGAEITERTCHMKSLKLI